MRAPYQVLVIPYKIINNRPMFAVLQRADYQQWQFVAGGGEDDETPLQAAKREAQEECGVIVNNLIKLNSMCYLPADIISERHRLGWKSETFVIPEYSFAFECKSDIIVSKEHILFRWMTYEDAQKVLQWDSNKTALYELNCILNNR